MPDGADDLAALGVRGRLGQPLPLGR
jgi:hypothetical protein